MIKCTVANHGDEYFNTQLLRAVDVLYRLDRDQQQVPKEYAIEVFCSLVEDCSAIKLEYKDVEMFCVYSTGVRSPHIQGYGIEVTAMISTEYSHAVMRRLIKFLNRVAVLSQCDWVSVNHKVRKGTYVSKILKVKSHG